MIRVHRGPRAFALLELIFAIGATAGTLFILGKLLLDGIYLQRVAAQHANRVAVTAALTERLRADALGATACCWGEDRTGLTLKLFTYADGAARQVHWLFRRDRVMRLDQGCESGLYLTDRLQFAARVRPETHSDVLTLDLIVPPPARAAGRPPRVSSTCILLPRTTTGPTPIRWEQWR